MTPPKIEVEVDEGASDTERAAAMQKAMEEARNTAPSADQEQNTVVESRFVSTFANNLNRSQEAIGYSKPLGVVFQDDGSFKGYADLNLSRTFDPGEPEVFLLEIDWERERLIATDLEHTDYHRDHTYRRSGMGFFGVYMVGRMLGGQRAAGVTGGRFSNMKMKPSGCHKTQPNAKRYGGKARSSGGARGPRIGK